jgi:beta-galactosidase
LHYEPAVFHTNWIDGGVNATDIVCPMYSPIDAIVTYGRDGQGTRPLIMCEFSHAMGNSNGSLADYVRAFETVPGLQGGFIWEWKDHALRQEHSGGQVRLAYGGQFGDTPNDSNFRWINARRPHTTSCDA